MTNQIRSFIILQNDISSNYKWIREIIDSSIKLKKIIPKVYNKAKSKYPNNKKKVCKKKNFLIGNVKLKSCNSISPLYNPYLPYKQNTNQMTKRDLENFKKRFTYTRTSGKLLLFFKLLTYIKFQKDFFLFVSLSITEFLFFHFISFF